MADFDLSTYGSFAPAIMTLVGSLQQSSGYRAAATAARLAGEQKAAEDQFEAQQLQVNAGQQIAAAQRTAQDLGLATELTLSHAKAMAAASGAGATDPTVVRLMANLAGQGAYKAQIALYEGEDKARSLRMAASAKGFQASIDLAAGESKGTAYDTAATSSLIAGSGSLFSKYGFGAGKTSTVGDGLRPGGTIGATDRWAQEGYGT